MQLTLLELAYAITEEVLQIDLHILEVQELLDQQQPLAESQGLIIVVHDHRMQDQQIMVHVHLVRQDQIIMDHDLLVLQDLVVMQDQRVLLDQTAVLDRLTLQDLEGTADLQMRLAQMGIAGLLQHRDLHHLDLQRLDHQVLDHHVLLVLAVAPLVEALAQEVEDLHAVVEGAFNSRQ